MFDKKLAQKYLFDIRTDRRNAQLFVELLENEQDGNNSSWYPDFCKMAMRKHASDENQGLDAKYQVFCEEYVIMLIKKYLPDPRRHDLLLALSGFLEEYDDNEAIYKKLSMENSGNKERITKVRCKIYVERSPNNSIISPTWSGLPDKVYSNISVKEKGYRESIIRAIAGDCKKHNGCLAYADTVIEELKKKYPNGLPLKRRPIYSQFSNDTTPPEKNQQALPEKSAVLENVSANTDNLGELFGTKIALKEDNWDFPAGTWPPRRLWWKDHKLMKIMGIFIFAGIIIVTVLCYFSETLEVIFAAFSSKYGDTIIRLLITGFFICAAIAVSILLITIIRDIHKRHIKAYPSHTMEQIADGVLGNRIILNSVSDNPDIGDEKNFLLAQQLENDSDGIWHTEHIDVKSPGEYLLKLYVCNNHPNGYQSMAEGVRVVFDIPKTKAKALEVEGRIFSRNTEPQNYISRIVFKSESHVFHLECGQEPAILYNGGIGKDGFSLGNMAIKQPLNQGVQIGYDGFDGRIPGGKKYASSILLKVRVVFDAQFIICQKVRLSASDRWTNEVNADIGDRVEFLVRYKNCSDIGKRQRNVGFKIVLPENLYYVVGSFQIWDYHYNIYSHLTRLDGDDAFNDGDFSLGDFGYEPGDVVDIHFYAEIIDHNLAGGANVLHSSTQCTVDGIVIQDHVNVLVQK